METATKRPHWASTPVDMTYHGDMCMTHGNKRHTARADPRTLDASSGDRAHSANCRRGRIRPDLIAPCGRSDGGESNNYARCDVRAAKWFHLRSAEEGNKLVIAHHLPANRRWGDAFRTAKTGLRERTRIRSRTKRARLDRLGCRAVRNVHSAPIFRGG